MQPDLSIPEDAFAGPFGEDRRRMITHQLLSRDIRDARVLEAMARTPRHEFVPQEMEPMAYEDGPLSIGHGQTISQPYIVAKMTDLAHIAPGDCVLDVGTGSGYQLAVLLEMGVQAYGIELIEPLALDARERLQRLGYRDFEIHCRNGYQGLPEQAPFQAIFLAASPPKPPPVLLEQLDLGGRLVGPIGEEHSNQILTVFTKKSDGRIDKESIFPVRFVPMIC